MQISTNSCTPALEVLEYMNSKAISSSLALKIQVWKFYWHMKHSLLQNLLIFLEKRLYSLLALSSLWSRSAGWLWGWHTLLLHCQHLTCQHVLLSGALQCVCKWRGWKLVIRASLSTLLLQGHRKGSCGGRHTSCSSGDFIPIQKSLLLQSNPILMTSENTNSTNKGGKKARSTIYLEQTMYWKVE